MTHEGLPLLLCRRLWPSFTGQLYCKLVIFIAQSSHCVSRLGTSLDESAVLCAEMFYKSQVLSSAQPANITQLLISSTVFCVLGSGKQKFALQADPQGNDWKGYDQNCGVQADGVAGPGVGEAEKGSSILALQLAL